MNVILFALQGVMPVFLLIVVGVILKKQQVVGEGFQKSASLICFKLGLPALVFLKIARLDLNQVFNPEDIAIVLGVTLLMLFSVMIASFRMKDIRQRGSFTQGSYRGNIAIVGLALILNLYGEEYAARGSMILAFMLPIYNIVSVLVLTLPLHGLTPRGFLKSLKNIITNPLIWSVLIAVGFSLLDLPIPTLTSRFLSYLSDLTIPLALINIGSSLSAHGLKKKGEKALIASLLKAVVLPAIGVTICYLRGYSHKELGMIFLILGAPTAVASHIMAEAMDNDGELAALIIMMTTSLAAVTSMIGLSIIEGLL